MSEKSLSSVLSAGIDVPKSYVRYLSCPVVEQKGDYICVKTPKGTEHWFKIRDNALKKLKTKPLASETSVFEQVDREERKREEKKRPEVQRRETPPEKTRESPEETRESLESKSTAKILAKIEALEEKLESLRFGTVELLKRIESLEEKSGIPELTKTLESKNKVLTQRIEALERSSAVPTLTETLESENKALVQRIEALEQSSAAPTLTETLESKSKALTQRIELIEGKLQEHEEQSRSEAGSEKKVPIESVMRASSIVLEGGKSAVKIGYKGGKTAAILGAKAVSKMPRKVLVATIVVMVLSVSALVFKPWKYLAGIFESTNENPLNTAEVPDNNQEKPPNHSASRYPEDSKDPFDTRGMVRYKGKWVTPRERAMLAERNEVPLGASDLEEWLEKSRSDSADTRREAARELARMSSSRDKKAAGNALIRLLKDEEVRYTALRSLNKLQYRKAAYELTKIVRNKNEAESIRGEAILALGATTDFSAMKTLMEMLDDSTEPRDIRATAAEALGLLGNPQAASALLQTLESAQDSMMQEALIRSLGRFSYPSAAPRLIALLEDANTETSVRVAAARSLGKIGARAKQGAQALLKAWEQGADGELREAIQEALSELMPRLSGQIKTQVETVLSQ